MVAWDTRAAALPGAAGAGGAHQATGMARCQVGVNRRRAGESAAVLTVVTASLGNRCSPRREQLRKLAVRSMPPRSRRASLVAPERVCRWERSAVSTVQAAGARESGLGLLYDERGSISRSVARRGHPNPRACDARDASLLVGADGAGLVAGHASG